jgi:hypothetical protein
MKALTYIMLGDTRYAPGEEVSREDLEAAGQTEEQIKELVDGGSLGETDTPLHPDHVPAEAPEGTIAASDGGGGNE